MLLLHSSYFQGLSAYAKQFEVVNHILILFPKSFYYQISTLATEGQDIGVKLKEREIGGWIDVNPASTLEFLSCTVLAYHRRLAQYCLPIILILHPLSLSLLFFYISSPSLYKHITAS